MEIKKFSASDINLYNTCPYKYMLSVTYQLPRVSQPYQEYGIFIHSVLDQYVKLHTFGSGYLSLEYLLKFYENDFPNYKTGKSHSIGEKLLVKYYEENFQGKECKMIEAEKKFGIDLGKFKITGRIDRTDKLTNEVYEVVDYKTGKVEDKVLRKDVQLLMYAFKTFSETDFKLKQCKVSLHYLNFGVFSDIILAEDLPPFREYLDNLYEEITNTVVFKPKKNQYCFNCEGKKMCPLFSKSYTVRVKKAIVL